MHPVTS